jgi:hypothetical protein
MKAAIVRTVLELAMPTRKMMSRTEPTTMYGLRRPHRLTV